jgi:hypothetical protein
MQQRAENELVPLQEIAEQEKRKGLMTGEALAALPNILNLGMLLKFYLTLTHLSVCFICSS